MFNVVAVDPVDTESTRMDSSFSLAPLSSIPSSPKKRTRVECRCGSDSCRKYLFWRSVALGEDKVQFEKYIFPLNILRKIILYTFVEYFCIDLFIEYIIKAILSHK